MPNLGEKKHSFCITTKANCQSWLSTLSVTIKDNLQSKLSTYSRPTNVATPARPKSDSRYLQSTATTEWQHIITALLVQMQMSQLLSRQEIPTYDGDPLQFNTFMKAFEHCVEAKTSCEGDCLYYLEQFTRGQPRDMVRSCLHMTAKSCSKRVQDNSCLHGEGHRMAKYQTWRHQSARSLWSFPSWVFQRYGWFRTNSETSGE